MIMPTLEFEATDVTGQKRARFKRVPGDLSIGELIDQTILPRLSLPRMDSQSKPISYSIRIGESAQSGRYLHRSEVAADALQSGDRMVLSPEINAG